ncbi:hypothetical protein GCM10011380_13920 [Sphingomonas metalli]|uniref:GH16 domain-containing protein n=1 Tax=Sphingomonas metalli TaxID=1779358 RepID=A0A916T0J0_9SPHN|nr:glycoside hydrolase family 16 protein [Sphingomonas metalli]GGB25584.1 hypothetical protein GCM10011380_13920 [Sphingomonas metalli]
MRQYLAAAVLILAAPAPGQETSLSADNYRVDVPLERPASARLVWRDEFDGDRLDPARWAYETERNRDGWYNHERQYYAAGRPENVRVAGGQLTITARSERLDPARFADWGGQAYTSGRITSTMGWRYGFYEVRARLPCGRGTWPAIWMLPQASGARWPDGGEIDIMEHVGFDPEVIHATLHSALYVHTKGTQRGAQRTLPGACGDFHRYQMRWTPKAIWIGVDDRAYLRVANDRPGGREAWPFDTPFRLILNLAVGGDWGGAKGIDDAALPQAMTVDYVRIWQEPAR